MRVTSSTSNVTRSQPRKRRLVARPVGAVAMLVVLSLVLGGFSPASAESLKSVRDRVRKQMVTAKGDVSADKSALAKAAASLRASQSALAAAQADLTQAQTQLASAQAADAALVAQVKAAEAAADQALVAEKAAAAQVEKQRAVITKTVRVAYQEQSDLVGFSLVVGAETPRQMSSRLQFNELAFNSTSNEYARLDHLQSEAAAATKAREATAASLTEKRKASADNVVQTKALAARAEAGKAKVATLVEANAKLQAVASSELRASQAQYEALEKQEAELSAKISGDSEDYSNPGGFIKPVNASAGSGFGMRYHPILHYWRMHWGTDFGASCGTPIRAMANGKVVSAGWTTTGFGNYTVISYGRMFGANISSGYAHQSKVTVRAGQRVTQGQVVGYVGTTGLSTGCHLHLQIYRNGTRVNPMRYL